MRMDQRIFHGEITPTAIAREIISHFNRGNFRVQQVGSGDEITVQIATAQYATSGGQTALSVSLQKVEDGLSVSIGKQAWLGVAASLGMTALSALRNPFALLGRLDDLAQDIESLQLSEEVWNVINNAARQAGASFELSERLRRMVCDFCNTPNPPGEASCIACGAPLGDVQPRTCSKCGFVIVKQEKFCPNCGQAVNQ